VNSLAQMDPLSFVKTVKDRCRVCYTCVRECPARAIKIRDGQAEIIDNSCLSCGNCVRVCSQDAKQVISSIEEVQELLSSNFKVAACIAPSFPAEFTEIPYQTLVSMLRRLGFDLVTEVGFGADIVAQEYRTLLNENKDKRYIATTCPAVVEMVTRYHPDLISNLAPIVSPMVAAARALRKIHGEDLKIVFIGPCVAKKLEASHESIEGNVDQALTFPEIRKLFVQNKIFPDLQEKDEFDPPLAKSGALFPIGGGMLQAADIKEDLMTGEVVSAEGLSEFTVAIKDFESGVLDAQLLEVLCCDGCIMGPGMTSTEPKFHRRSRVSKYVRNRNIGENDQHEAVLPEIDAANRFSRNDQRHLLPSEEEVEAVLQSLGKQSIRDELNCGACGYHSCRAHAIAIIRGRAEKEMCLPYSIDQMKKTVDELQLSNQKLANAQEALLQSEKLASMGQLAAGVAHEVNNPLGVVLMYSHILLEDESVDENLREDLKMICDQADRCKRIVSNLLDFARENKVLLEPSNIDDLLQRAILSVPKPDNINVSIENHCSHHEFELDSDQILQVFTNMISNAYAAMESGGSLKLSAHDVSNGIEFWIEDTGTGIPEEIKDKIFDPFFTTKSIGKGTGLGLAVTYGVVKMHRGKIIVESNTNAEQGPTGTKFRIYLPETEQMIV
jgi:two-component system NtrC family sensor kinase